ncbi:hypothetical protein [uncultured Cytophaga sp.]|uniref:hypothetical protein n=1 Tax=uncultured Cytophaga sp. TaxID=160238 RepID=UPI00260EDA3F|nr:hypothetical protein [uncultured Cytophaga sp.]
MKKQLSLIAFILFAFILQSQSPVQPDPTKTKYMILKTNRLLGMNHMAVKNGKIFTGDFGKGIQYERYAKQLYLAKEYKKAAQFTYRAREFSIASLVANKAKPTSDGSFTSEEKMMTSPLPEVADMDKELSEKNIAKPTDEELLVGNLDIAI